MRLEVSLREWDSATPDELECLQGTSLDGHAGARDVARKLATESRLTVRELARGLSLQTGSHVGSVDIGPLRVIIRPKLGERAFIPLLRYSLGLSDVTLHDRQSDVKVAKDHFQDLLLAQLVEETRQLLSRGVRREYRYATQRLASPRGRLLFNSFSQRPWDQAHPACRFAIRSEDNLPNRLLAAGLELGIELAIDRALAAQLRLLLLQLNVTPVALNQKTFHLWEQTKDRLTIAYEPALRLVQLLACGVGRGGDETRASATHGFLFDMNRFFQELLDRFFRAHLVGHHLSAQHLLRDLFTYDDRFRPQRDRRPPTPRPDFAIMTGREVIAVLDAKYRDLWSTELPAQMLYQLSVYALSQERTRCATIIYPTDSPMAREVRISINGLIHGQQKASVILRPLRLDRLAELLCQKRTAAIHRRLDAYARHLAFGEPSTESA